MITEDELKKYLPKYLSEENYNNLLTELKSFPYNIDNRMYTYSLDNNIIYQGDGIKEMPIIDLLRMEKLKMFFCRISQHILSVILSVHVWLKTEWI